MFDAALQHQQAGRTEQAESLCRQILAQQPEHGDALHLLGILQFASQPKPAVELLRRAVAVDPRRFDYHNNLGIALANLGQWEAAMVAYRQALGLRPDFADGWFNLGTALQTTGRAQESAAAFERAAALRPDHLEAHTRLGIALSDMGKRHEAIAAFQRALSLDPNCPEALHNLANALHANGRVDEAISMVRQALALRPDFDQALILLGNAQKDIGQLDAALASNDRAMQLRPDDASLHSNRLYTLHFHPDYDAAALLREHLAYNARHAAALAKSIRSHDNDPSPDRPLRIGYVSADLRSHPVGMALEPLLAHHDHTQFQIICFANAPIEDEVTRRLRACSDRWHCIAGWSDQQVAELVRGEKIDILVDLSLHLGHNRLLVFAQKPAPVQVTYLGYPSTTGLSTMDYRLGDPYIDPPGTERYYVEQTIRLPRTYLCWKWSGKDLPISELPALSNGYVTFGSLNNFCKVTPAVLETWGKVLAAVKDSRLILRCPPGQTSVRVRQTLAQRGIDPQRIELFSRLPLDQYVALCSRQDIGLDPFPYPGHTTSLDSLWLGVPMVTLAGNTAVSRAGVSLLYNLNLPELIARAPDQYVAIARALAEDLPRLAELRRGLRSRLQSSPLTDGPGFARDVEAAYRAMWRRWCQAR